MLDSQMRSSIDAAVNGTEQSLDDVFTSLANERRRRTLSTLLKREPPTDVTTVARALAADGADATDENAPPEQIEQVKTSLYHVHLPKLADLGLISFDSDEMVVEEVIADLST